MRERVLQLAADDSRVVAAAEVGSFAAGSADRWSDLDLTFAVDDAADVGGVVADWTRSLTDELAAVHLFDLARGATLYRVFLLPGCLQVDLSFTPAAAFGPAGPNFRLLFGTAVQEPLAPAHDPRELFGYAVLFALHARVSIERGRFWQAEYWLGELRDHALGLAALRRGLPSREGRGADDLPPEVHARFEPALVRSLDRQELLRALAAAVTALLAESDDVRELAAKVAPALEHLALTQDPAQGTG